MPPFASVAAAHLGATAISLQDLLRQEHLHGQLLPLLQRAAREAFLLDQARALGLRVEDADMQQAADLFRRRRQLHSAEQTKAWLAQRRWSGLLLGPNGSGQSRCGIARFVLRV